AIVEIELHVPPGYTRNLVICTEISTKGQAKWWVNGRPVTHKAVRELSAALHMPVSNLCQFLPQEKVSEFARYTPVELLNATLEAAAPESAMQLRDLLKDLDSQLQSARASAGRDQGVMANLERRHRALQLDVDRYNQRQGIERLLRNLTGARFLWDCK